MGGDVRVCLVVSAASSPHALAPSPLEAGVGQQLPPACGARQLSKLKRFLTTLQQFGSDISPEIGERVRTLVLGLVVRRARLLILVHARRRSGERFARYARYRQIE